MYNKQANLTNLRVIGARAFVHNEKYTKKLDDRAFEGKLCGFSQDSNAYRIYNPSKAKVVESRNVTFIETPAYTLPSNITLEDHGYEEDVIQFTTALGGVQAAEDTFDGWDGSTADQQTQIELLRQEIRTLRHNNKVREEILEQERTYTTTSEVYTPTTPGIGPDEAGVASSPGIASEQAWTTNDVVLAESGDSDRQADHVSHPKHEISGEKEYDGLWWVGGCPITPNTIGGA